MRGFALAVQLFEPRDEMINFGFDRVRRGAYKRPSLVTPWGYRGALLDKFIRGKGCAGGGAIGTTECASREGISQFRTLMRRFSGAGVGVVGLGGVLRGMRLGSVVQANLRV